MIPTTDARRFLSNLSPEPNTGCWLWTGCCTSKNRKYLQPEFRILKKKTVAARVAFCLSNGLGLSDIAGLDVLHRCDNSLCMNAKHLFLGTQSDNMKDMWNKNRGVSGERHPNAKLTKSDLAEIRKLKALGVSQKKIARQFGVQQPCISRLLSGRSWRRVALSH